MSDPNEDWKKRYDSLAIAQVNIEDKERKASIVISILEAEKKQWVIQKNIQDQVIEQQLRNSDSVVCQLQDEIMVLKAKLKAK